MKLIELIIETSDRADFYFCPESKVITREFNESYIALSFRGELVGDTNKCRAILDILEMHSLYGRFDDCSNFDELGQKQV